MVSHAFENSTGYVKDFRMQVSALTIMPLDDFRQFPFIGKRTLRDDLEKFSVPMDHRSYCTTGGAPHSAWALSRSQIVLEGTGVKGLSILSDGLERGDRSWSSVACRSSRRPCQWVPEFNELRCSSYHLVPEQWNISISASRLSSGLDSLLSVVGLSICAISEGEGLSFPRVKGILVHLKISTITRNKS